MIENADIEKALSDLPDQVADALFAWRKAEADRARLEGEVWLRIKEDSAGTGEKLTSEDLRAKVKSHPACFEARILEANTEAVHARLYERLMALKRTSAMRAAF